MMDRQILGEKLLDMVVNIVANMVVPIFYNPDAKKPEIDVETDLDHLHRDTRNWITDENFDHFYEKIAVALDVQDVKEEFHTYKMGRCSRRFAKRYFADRIQKISKEYDRVHRMSEEALSRFNQQRGQDSREEGSLQDDRRFHGRQEETKEIVDELLKFRSGDKVQVISIVGCCGSGTTSLARKIFEVAGRKQEKKEGCSKNHFFLPIWVSFSKKFDSAGAIKKIIEAAEKAVEKAAEKGKCPIKAAEKGKCPNLSLDLLEKRLMGIIVDTRFLLVLDNLRIEDLHFWENLRTILMFGEEGSRILVTTEDEKVANRMKTVYKLCLRGLPVEDGWLLFQDEINFKDERNKVLSEQSRLEDIGKDIVKKFHGLPLAIKAVSIILGSQTNEDEWQLLSDELFENTEVADAIMPFLKTSYDHLPLNLKRCFSFCSTFPKDYEFDKDEFVKLWMATGLMKNERESYFDDLVCRSFFQASDSNMKDGRKYKMPSVIYELAHHLLRNESLRINQDVVEHGESGNARYGLLYHHDKQLVTFDKMLENKSLQAFMLYGGNGILVKEGLIDLFEKLRFLRVLDLSNSCLEELPDSVCKLSLLCYLSLRGTDIKKLPETVGNLQHLQTLELGNCHQIQELPDSIGNLTHLRHLGLHNTSIRRLPKTVRNLLNLQTLELGNCFELETLPKCMEKLVKMRNLDFQLTVLGEFDLISMPPGISYLTSLRHLSRFVEGSELHCGLGELKDTELRGKPCIAKLEKVVGVHNVETADLSDKRYTDSLTLRWRDVAFTESKNVPEEYVIDQLEPHKNLLHLCVENYNGKKFPAWMGDPSFLKLEVLKLINCKMCSSLPCVWNLPSLKMLEIKNLHGVKSFGFGLSGFEKLEKLDMSDMPNLETWFVQAGLMRCLTALCIFNCPNLKYPSYLPPSIKTLELKNCKQLQLGVHNVLPNLTDLVLESDSGSRLLWVQVLTSLTSLTLSKISLIQDEHKGILKRVLNDLTYLKQLKVQECNDLDSIDGLKDHSSLEYLEITSCHKLSNMDFPKRLKELHLHLCPSLKSLSNELRHLSSLHVVEIHSVSLESMPKLPVGVQKLLIKECSVLSKRCQNNGDDWPNIQHIPYIQVDQNEYHHGISFHKQQFTPFQMPNADGDEPHRRSFTYRQKKMVSRPHREAITTTTHTTLVPPSPVAYSPTYNSPDPTHITPFYPYSHFPPPPHIGSSFYCHSGYTLPSQFPPSSFFHAGSSPTIEQGASSGSSSVESYFFIVPEKEMREQNKQNQASGIGSFLQIIRLAQHIEHRRKLKMTLERDPIIVELHARTHKHQEDQHWDDDRSQQAYDKFVRLRDLQSQSTAGQESSQQSDYDLWTQVIGGKKKKRIYELGVQGLAFEAQTSHVGGGDSMMKEIVRMMVAAFIVDINAHMDVLQVKMDERYHQQRSGKQQVEEEESEEDEEETDSE